MEWKDEVDVEAPPESVVPEGQPATGEAEKVPAEEEPELKAEQGTRAG